MMRWSFRIEHVAGAKNFGPHALSRYPSRAGVLGVLGGSRVAGPCSPALKPGTHRVLETANGVVCCWGDDGPCFGTPDPRTVKSVATPQQTSNVESLEEDVLATASVRAVRVLDWDEVRGEGVSDPDFASLLQAMESGGDSWDGPGHYKPYRNALSNVDGVALYKGRVVVPVNLRGRVLDSLHQAHQGTTSMSLRAGNSVWWPGLAADLGRTREQCTTCRVNAPSQPAAPPKPLPSPDYPFQMISGDYFHYAGKEYLLLVDRYSGWPVVAQSTRETQGELT